MMRRPGVKGPIMTTRSVHDTAVGAFYPAAVSLVLQDPNFRHQSYVNQVGRNRHVRYSGLHLAAWIDRWSRKRQITTSNQGKLYNLGGQQIHQEDARRQRSTFRYRRTTGSSRDLAGSVRTDSGSLFVPAQVAAAQGAGASSGQTSTIAPAGDATTVTSRRTSSFKRWPAHGNRNADTVRRAGRDRTYCTRSSGTDLDHIQEGLRSLRQSAPPMPMHRILAAIRGRRASMTSSRPGGVSIFASATPAAEKQAIKDALKPLLDLRASQAGDLFKDLR